MISTLCQCGKNAGHTGRCRGIVPLNKGKKLVFIQKKSGSCECGKPAGHFGRCTGAGLGQKRPPKSAETLARMSAAQQGKKHSAETCAKMSASRLGKKKGAPSAEARKNISLALSGLPSSRQDPDFDECKALPLGARLAIRQQREGFRNPIRLDKLAPDGKTWIVDVIADLLISPFPNPFESVCQREEWDQERRFEQWQRHRSRLV
jgi:hypothetical protein